MIVISHRGNLTGKNLDTENTVKQLELVMSKNIPVEVDVRNIFGQWYLGHDQHDNKIDVQFLLQNKDMMWCHAKNIEALEKMLDIGLHCFWHQTDEYTLTSKGIVWAYPSFYTSVGILVMPSKDFIDNLNRPIYGLCVDDPINYL